MRRIVVRGAVSDKGASSNETLETWPGMPLAFECVRSHHGVRGRHSVADGRITIVRKTAGAAKGFLRHAAGDPAVSDEESLQDALNESTSEACTNTGELLRGACMRVQVPTSLADGPNTLDLLLRRRDH